MNATEADLADNEHTALVLVRCPETWTSLERLVFAKCACGGDRADLAAA
jgi:hypothetical protein